MTTFTVFSDVRSIKLLRYIIYQHSQSNSINVLLLLKIIKLH